jgi:hypothetical protein
MAQLRSEKQAKLIDLEKRLKTLMSEFTSSKQLVDDMFKRQREVDGMIKNIEGEIYKLKMSMPENLTVTNHAMLRYAERRYGFQAAKVEQEIKDMCKGAELGLDEVHFNGFVIKNNAVITYLPSAVDLARDPGLSWEKK